ncbi:hypothetical protein HGRIS_009278 [Hohenbuehelia grisea]|uniref:Uncharacterized protein n=1 Tax=Hohenbuehelia grisea TaxID=104357 RepID=A0ABR3J155_9AGAR
MVFANLQSYEKDAFFSLLDEYFASRPEIFAQAGAAPGSNAELGTAAASAARRAVAANPEAASKAFSAGIRSFQNQNKDPSAPSNVSQRYDNVV